MRFCTCERSWSDSGAFLIPREHASMCDSMAARGFALRSCLGDVMAFAIRTLQLYETAKYRGLQIKPATSKAKKADLGTNVLPDARLRAFRAACRIVTLGELKPDSIDDNGDDESNKVSILFLHYVGTTSFGSSGHSCRWTNLLESWRLKGDRA